MNLYIARKNQDQMLYQFIKRFAFVFLLFSSTSFAFHPGHLKYVIVGAYADKTNATKSVVDLNAKDVTASILSFSYPGKRTLHYVYTASSESLKDMIVARDSIKTQSGFEKAWIFISPRSGDKLLSEAHQKDIQKGDGAAPWQDLEEEMEPSTIMNKGGSVQEEKPVLTMTNSIDKISVAETEIEVPTDQDILNANAINPSEAKYFNLKPYAFNLQNKKLIPATINITDGEQNTLVASIKSNEYFKLAERKNQRHKVQFVCTSPGYHAMVYDVDLDNPVSDSTKSFLELKQDTINMSFDMKKLQLGEIQTLYHIFFYKDATVMKKQSKYELNNLFMLMNENPSVKIRVHGHTNGNSFGKMIKLVADDTNFFQLTKNNKQTAAGAVELSKERGITIKRYLVSKGIEEDRVDVKGWGGKKMIYEKDDLLATKNIRVEIEITQE